MADKSISINLVRELRKCPTYIGGAGYDAGVGGGEERRGEGILWKGGLQRGGRDGARGARALCLEGAVEVWRRQRIADTLAAR